MQARETFQDGPGLTGTINRARVFIQGGVKPAFTYRVAVEFAAPSGTSASPSLRDAYIRWSHEWFTATGGQCKTPFSREFLTSLADLEVADRSFVVDSLATKRDIGVMAEGTNQWGTLSLGVFNGEGQNVVVNRDSTQLVVGRAVFRPVAPISIGGDIALTGDNRRRMGAEANVEYRGAFLRGEYIADRLDGRERDDFGWYLLGGYRIFPWLQAIARDEDFERPTAGPARRISRVTGGLNFDLPGGQTRFIADYEGTTTGAARTRTDYWIAQLQVKF
ncbi:MAG TPA: porin [Candidatus Eisenbacteria bacterium]|nr:porin [Candidatus Eisenbacteria bacterium]